MPSAFAASLMLSSRAPVLDRFAGLMTVVYSASTMSTSEVTVFHEPK
jgi:hypothetical protein